VSVIYDYISSCALDVGVRTWLLTAQTKSFYPEDTWQKHNIDQDRLGQ
jgi:hypothetical protein